MDRWVPLAAVARQVVDHPRLRVWYSIRVGTTATSVTCHCPGWTSVNVKVGTTASWVFDPA
jgi:exosortase/archaeosortase